METRPIVEHLKQLADSMRKKIEELRAPLAQSEKDLEHIMGVLDLCSRNAQGPSVATTVVVTNIPSIVGNLRGLSQKQAVIMIARANGGIIKAQHAKHLMIEAGIMKSTKNSTRMVHNAIINSERFDRIAPGEFRLKVAPVVVSNVPPRTAPVAIVSNLFPPKPPVH